MRVWVADGTAADTLTGVLVPTAGTLVGHVLDTGRPVRLATPFEQPDVSPVLASELELGPVMIIPLIGAHETHGVLSLARLPGRPAFAADDLDMATGFANHAAIAVELAQARVHHHAAALLDQRERIAAELNGQITQRVFAASLKLQGLLTRAGAGTLAPQLRGVIADLDHVVEQVNSTAFDLTPDRRPARRPPQIGVLAVLDEAASELGFTPTSTFEGSLPCAGDGPVAQEVVEVVRGIVGHIAHQRRPTALEVRVAHDTSGLSVTVIDDGALPVDTIPATLAVLARRAREQGGDLSVTPLIEGVGSRWEWLRPNTGTGGPSQP
jgi:signal transduction histidine kinase